MTAMPSTLTALAKRLELWPIDRLRPYERNPRTHSADQVAQIAASMVEFGFTNPILVDESDGILAGHGRLMAARELGLDEVPVVRLGHLTPAQKRAYVIADNQLALRAGWNESLLAEELAWLRDETFDLDLLGFDAGELEALLAPTEGEIEAKLHLHWILQVPAIGPEALEKLHKARSLACDLVGADATSKAIVHPLRWPGSLHRKRPGDPRLCRIVDQTDNRLDLDEALEELSGLEALRDSVEGFETRQEQPGGKNSPLSGDLLADCAALIPNDDGTDWATWNRLGMAYWRASEGSAEGFDAFDAWSRKSGKYDAKATKARWEHYATSPPDKIGSGTLIFLARKVDPSFRRHRPEQQEAGQEQEAEGDALEPLRAAVAEVNERYFVADMGGPIVIGTFHRDLMLGREKLAFVKRADFVLKFSTRHYTAGFSLNGNPITKDLGTAWLNHYARRSYERVTMSTRTDLPPDVLNLWRGFGCVARPGDWSTIKWHLFHIISGGNKRDYKYLIKLFARWVQNPVERGEVAFVMRGKKGVGKGVVAKLLARIFKHHAMATSQARDLIGNFNSHLADCCLLFLDEALWAGDKAGEGVLKTMVTEPLLRVEPKGIDVFSVLNRLKIIMATNNEWVVPATAEERRYFVRDVLDTKANDHAYMAKLHKAVEGAEAEAFLHYLLNLDLTGFNHRDVPHTAALNEQKLISGDSFQKWWGDCLYAGALLGSEEYAQTWPSALVRKTDMHNAYVNYAQDHGDRHGLNMVQLAKRLKEVTGKVAKATKPRTPDGRVPMFTVPSLECARAEFQKFMRIDAFDWSDDDE